MPQSHVIAHPIVHAVRFSVVQRELIALRTVDVGSIHDILERWLVACIITRGEGDLLTVAGLRPQMPSGWDGEDVLARYRKVGIEVTANGRVPSVAAEAHICA